MTYYLRGDGIRSTRRGTALCGEGFMASHENSSTEVPERRRTALRAAASPAFVAYYGPRRSDPSRPRNRGERPQVKSKTFSTL